MDREKRVQYLKKEAAKKKLSLSPLSGKINRRDIDKHLKRIKEVFTEASTTLRAAKSEAERIALIIEENTKLSSKAKKEMAKFYEILHNMDLASCSTVKVNGPDEVFYEINGRWHTVDREGNFNRKVRKSIETSEEGDIIGETTEEETTEEELDLNALDDGFEIIQ